MLAPWKKNYEKPRQPITKHRHHFEKKVHTLKVNGFSSSHVWMWEPDHKESWAPKNWCFWTVVLDKTLESPWIAGRLSQSILKEINPEYLLEGLILKLKLRYFGYLMQRTDSLEKTLMLGKTEDKRRRSDRGRDGWMASWTQWTWVWANSGR